MTRLQIRLICKRVSCPFARIKPMGTQQLSVKKEAEGVSIIQDRM
jgi:hypothetical protein